MKITISTILAILCLTSTVAKADEYFQMLSYKEFRLLNDADQVSYVEKVQEFTAALERAGTPVSWFESVPVSEKWAALASLVAPAQAARLCAGGSFSLGPQTRLGSKFCFQPSNSRATGGARSEVCGAEAVEYAADCYDKFQEFVKANPDAAARLQSYKAQVELKVAAAKTPVKGDTPSLKPKEEEKKFRCIYGGFVRYQESADKKGDCKPQSEWTDAKGKIYSCPPADAKGDAVNRTVLCNPVLFGTNKDKPICMWKGGDATKRCLEFARKNKTIDSAIKLSKENEKDFNELTKKLNDLCQGDEGERRGRFTKLGFDQKSSQDDLVSTCTKYGEAFADYNAKNGPANPARGNR